MENTFFQVATVNQNLLHRVVGYYGVYRLDCLSSLAAKPPPMCTNQ
jgi:hypothetical protein